MKMMKFLSANLKNRPKAEALVIPFWKEKKKTLPASSWNQSNPEVNALLKTEDFLGKEGEVAFVYAESGKEPRIVLLGLGDKDKISVEKLRRAYASLIKACRAKKVKEINLVVPQIKELKEEKVVRGMAEGLLLANYSFDKMKHDCLKEQPTILLTTATILGISDRSLAIAKKCQKVTSGVYLARDLVNDNAKEVTPQLLSKMAQDISKQFPKIKTTVFNRQRIEKEKMGLLLAVSQGSQCDPAFIIMEYRGNPKSKDLTAIIGKGVTFDTGGLNLKPTGSMETMRCDMGGAATVLGTLKSIADLGLKINVVGVIPSTENAIGPSSFKPGDVYTAFSGKTVEIGNTDAEGRLILADAIAYTCKHFNPARIIDFATLTGAMEIALGNETTGVMSNRDDLANALIEAGNETFERVWRLPLFEEYKEQLKSEIADIKNIGGRPAGSITAALFLQEFVGDTPWAHCDIAGTAYLSEARRYHPKFGTGIGVRLMVEFFEKIVA